MRKFAAVLISLVLVLGVLAACSKSNEGKSEESSAKPTQTGESSTPSAPASSPEASPQASPEASPSEPVTLKVWRPANIVDASKDPIMQEIGKRLNVNIEIVTAPWDQANNKLNLIMQSQEEIDIIQADFSANPWQKWTKDGLMYNLDELLQGKEDQFPYIQSITQAGSFAGLKVDGQRYFVPGSHHGQDWGLFLRKDWLDKLQLQPPKTMDDFYHILQAFKTKDPDGNGKPDTIGYQFSMPGVDNFGDLDPIMHAFGGSFGGFFEDYVIRDGKVTALETTEDTKAGFKFINKLYREGLINRDFVNHKNVDSANAKYLYANKAGAVWTSRTAEFETNIQKTEPAASLEFVSPISAAGHQFIATQGMAWWMLAGIPKTSKHPMEALKFIEFVNSQEGRELLVAGIKGSHYTQMTADGVYDRNNDNWAKDYDVKANGYDYPLWWGFLTTVHGYIPVKDHPTFEEALDNEVIYVSEEDSKKKFNWKTSVKYGGEYNEPNPFHAVYIDSVQDPRRKIQNDVKSVYYLKMITAKNEQEVDKLWDQYIKAWKAAGGDQVIADYQKFYDDNLKQ